MKKFNFTLESILNLKENLEENEKMTLYALKTKLDVLHGELSTLTTIYQNAVAELKEKSLTGITIVKLTEHTHYIKEVDRQRVIKQNEINEMLVKVENQTQVLMQVSIEVKTLLKLKEEQQKQYDEGVTKENELLIEDFISGRINIQTV